MVLEEASGFDSIDDQSNGAEDSLYPSGIILRETTLISSQDGKVRWTVDLDTLPKPWGLQWLHSIDRSPKYVSLVAHQMKQSEILLGRPLKQAEVDAVAHNLAHSMQWISYTLPTSLVAATALTYRGRSTYNVPFTQLARYSWFNPEKLGPLRGFGARTGWHTLRFCTWQVAAIMATGLFCGSMARSTAMAGLMTDPRMKDLKEKVMQVRAQGAPEQPAPSQRHSVETQEGRMDTQAMRADSAWRRARQNQRPSPKTNDDDDMSPTGGAFMDDLAGSDDTGLLSDDQMQMNERRREYEAAVAERNARNKPQPGQQQQQQEQNQQWRRQTDQGGVGSPTAPGSTWEKLRREAASRPASGGPRQDEPRSRSTTGNDFTFSQRDEDRQLARDEAQKDFDARVERERHGSEFDGGNRGGRW